MDVSSIVQFLVSGVFIGGLYGIAAIGLSMIFGVMKVINFAQADFLMLSMYITYFLYFFWGLRFYLSILLIALLFFLAGLALMWGVMTHVVGRPSPVQILCTVGLSIILQNVVLAIWGSSGRTLFDPVGQGTITVGNIYINQGEFIGLISSLVIVVILHRLLTKTEVGRILRATSDDKELATLFGINEKRIYAIALGLGISLEGFAGVFLSLKYVITPTVGSMFSLIMFSAVVLGGLGHVMGSFIGGIIIGIIQAVTLIIAWTQWQNIAIFGVLILILLLKPKGLFGR